MLAAPNGHSIILGEEDPDVCRYLEMALQYQGYSVEVAQNGQEVLACFQGREKPVSAVVLDAMMPGMGGIDALKEIRRFSRQVPVIMMSGASSPLDIAEAMRSGANDFIAKPINGDALRKTLKTLIETKPAAPSSQTEGTTSPPAGSQVFCSTSPAMRELQKFAASVGRSDAPVLIQGETGVGKEVFARELHACSRRAKKSMFKLNCAALPSELVESELFGYERGAFTGAFQKKLGMFELADGGAILLDEIGDMDFKLQAKLLQVLQDHEFQRLGGKDTVRVDVRVIAATHCDLENAIVRNRFREDLYYRLNVITLHLPPLRDRKDDIIPLADFFIRKHTEANTVLETIPATLKAVFLDYHWPGNIRELENVVRKFIVFGDAAPVEQELRCKILRPPGNKLVAITTVPAAETPLNEGPGNGASGINGSNGTKGCNETNHSNGIHEINGPNGHLNGAPGSATPVLAQVAAAKRAEERAAILAALRATNWNRKQAAVQLQIDYKALLYKMKVLSITKPPALTVAAEGR